MIENLVILSQLSNDEDSQNRTQTINFQHMPIEENQFSNFEINKMLLHYNAYVIYCMQRRVRANVLRKKKRN